MPGKLDAIVKVGEMLTPLLGTVPGVGAALPLAVRILKAYKTTRDRIEAMNPGTSGMLSDAELINLLDQDAEALVDHADALLAKWGPPPQ